MKKTGKYIQLFFPASFPYLVLITFIFIVTGVFANTVFQNNIIIVLILLIVFYIIALACSVVFFMKNLLNKTNPKNILRINMIIKLLQIPAYILIFLFGLLNLITIFTAAITIVLMFLDGMAIFLTGLIGLCGIIRGFLEGKLSKKTAVIHGLLQFIFCADVISCIIVYKKVKNNEAILNNTHIDK